MLDPITHPHEEFTADPSPPTPRQIFRELVKEIAAEHGVTEEDILGRSYVPSIIEARLHAYYHTARRMPTVPMNKIARMFGRDHGTFYDGLIGYAVRNKLPTPVISYVRRWI